MSYFDLPKYTQMEKVLVFRNMLSYEHMDKYKIGTDCSVLLKTKCSHFLDFVPPSVHLSIRRLGGRLVGRLVGLLVHWSVDTSQKEQKQAFNMLFVYACEERGVLGVAGGWMPLPNIVTIILAIVSKQIPLFQTYVTSYQTTSYYFQVKRK